MISSRLVGLRLITTYKREKKMRNRISKRLGFGVTYSEKLKSGVHRLTYVNTRLDAQEAYRRIGDDVQNIVVKESQTELAHYIRVYVY